MDSAIIIAVVWLITGLLIGRLIFGRETDGTMYFYKDAMDDKEYTFAQFNAKDISEIDKKKIITLKCVKLPEDFDITSLSH